MQLPLFESCASPCKSGFVRHAEPKLTEVWLGTDSLLDDVINPVSDVVIKILAGGCRQRRRGTPLPVIQYYSPAQLAVFEISLKCNKGKRAKTKVSTSIDNCRVRRNARDSVRRSESPAIRRSLNVMNTTERLDSSVKKALTSGERRVETSEASTSVGEFGSLNFPVFNHFT